MLPILLQPRHYYSAFKQFSQFVISPNYNPVVRMTVVEKVSATWTMFVVKLILAIIVGVSIGLFYDPENLTRSRMAERFTPAVLIMLSLVLLPMLEEIGFRLSLKFKPIWLASTLGVLGYYLMSKVVFETKLTDIYIHFDIRVAVSVGIVLLSYLLFSIQQVKRGLEQFWENNFRWIFYSFCLLFAWMHIFNYELTLAHLLLMPIITMDKLVSALCYGYVRVNYGFFYSFAMHFINNSIGVTISLISSSS